MVLSALYRQLTSGRKAWKRQIDPKCREKYFGGYDFDGDYNFVDSCELTNELLREISRLGGVYLFVVDVMAVKKHGKWKRLLKEDSS